MHVLVTDIEAVSTDDGDPQPRQSVFVECLDMQCECQGKFILHDQEVSDYIENAEVMKKKVLEILAEMEEHRTRYTEENAKDGDPYWRGRRDEAGHFRDKLRAILKTSRSDNEKQ